MQLGGMSRRVLHHFTNNRKPSSSKLEYLFKPDVNSLEHADIVPEVFAGLGELVQDSHCKGSHPALPVHHTTVVLHRSYPATVHMLTI